MKCFKISKIFNFLFAMLTLLSIYNHQFCLKMLSALSDKTSDNIIYTNMIKKVSKKALLHNINFLKSKCNNKCLFCAVVKANAYGHGVEKIIKYIKNEINYYAVSSLKEATEILNFDKNKPVLILTPNCEIGNNDLIEYTVTNLQGAKILERLANNKNLYIKVHIKINTGMNRYGEKNIKSLQKIINFIKSSKFLMLKGIFTHYAESENEIELMRQQQQFDKMLSKLRYSDDIIVHSNNSGAVLNNCKNRKNYSMVRCGLGIYGYGNNDLIPVLSIISKVAEIQTLKKGERAGYNFVFTAIQKTRLAVIKMGYADGFSKKLENNWVVLIKGKKVKVIAVCMDAITIDITNIKYIRAGTPVIILGSENNANLMAENLGAITYEVLTNFNNLRQEADKRQI